MFSQKRRLTSKLIQTLLIEGKKRFSPYFFVVFSKKKESFRSSVIFSKKVIKKRVHRNREKRRILALLRNITEEDTGFSEYHIALWGKIDTGNLSSLELEKELRSVFSSLLK